ncbi:MAG: type II toxin-antitoxin system RelE/ParE family toxin [candidate division Zixibacteria bacterium]|nr:type II toxin-antitoxin system RelE/ParE family toxin [candidate division Zixibacteria bacterium]
MYKLILTRRVEKFLADHQKVDLRLFNQFIRALDEISKNPYCAKALVGNLKGYYSYRVREYRILFEIEKKKLFIYVEKIEHRKGVYR